RSGRDLALTALAAALAGEATGPVLLDVCEPDREDDLETVGNLTRVFPCLLDRETPTGALVRLDGSPPGDRRTAVGYGAARYDRPETAEVLDETPRATVLLTLGGAAQDGPPPVGYALAFTVRKTGDLEVAWTREADAGTARALLREWADRLESWAPRNPEPVPTAPGGALRSGTVMHSTPPSSTRERGGSRD
ncbi:hypothetical protein ACFQ08_44480, partial [Streptosporangium algeriense]